CGAVDEVGLLINRFGFSPDEEPSQIRDRLLAGLKNPLQRLSGKRLSGSDDTQLETDEDQDAQVVQTRIDQRLPALFEDILAFPGKSLKDRFWTMPQGAARTSAGVGARAIYERAFGETDGTYSGINAATLALATGDKPAAHSIANKVLAR